MKISFRAPLQILRVFVHQKQTNEKGSTVMDWQEVNGLQSAVQYASSYIDSTKPKEQDPDRADFNVSKRRIEWNIKNLRGG